MGGLPLLPGICQDLKNIRDPGSKIRVLVESWMPYFHFVQMCLILLWQDYCGILGISHVLGRKPPLDPGTLGLQRENYHCSGSFFTTAVVSKMHMQRSQCTGAFACASWIWYV